MKILIDNGHGIDTKGKRSPDGRLLEYRENSTSRLTAATRRPAHTPGSCETASTIGPPEDLRPSVSATSTGITRPEGKKGV